MLVTDFDKRQTELLHQLATASIEGFEGYNIEKMLFNVSGEALRTDWKSALIKVIRTIFIDNVLVEKNVDQPGKPMLISYDYHRQDHTGYWNKFKKIVEDYSEIMITEGTKSVHKIRKISDVFRVAIIYHKAKKSLNFVEGNATRNVLAANLADLAIIRKKIDQLQFSGRAGFIFFDGNRVENLIVQNLRNRGITVATMQHGQPVFHGKDCDRINQTMILNFSSDYIMVTGEYSKKQFMLGGIPEDQIFVGGSLREVRPIQDVSGDDFALFLDCPTNPNAARDNKELIDCAERISEDLHSKYVIKCHPQDDPINYREYRIQNGSFLPKGKTISDALKNKSFAILHASGVYLDILANGTKAFCYINDTDFPLVEEGMDSFASTEELIEKNKEWRTYTSERKKMYMNSIIKYYLYPEGVDFRYKTFADKLSTGKKVME